MLGGGSLGKGALHAATFFCCLLQGLKDLFLVIFVSLETVI
jgi:hypothetical protein